MQIKPLTSMRFIFAIMVMMSHCGQLSPLFNSHFFQEGFVGVSFFFILSGFIISYSNKQRLQSGEISANEFRIARIARIYPMHILTLVIAATLTPFVITDLARWASRLIPNLLLFQAFIPKDNYYYSFNSPSWSLSCEIFFYMLFPVFIGKFNTLKKQLWMMITLSAIILAGMHFTPEDQKLVNTIWYVNPVFRFNEFIIGMTLHSIYERTHMKNFSFIRTSFMEITAVAVFIASYILAENCSIVYRASAYYWIPVSIIIFIFSLQKGVISRLLSCRWMVFLGEISFGFYMFHMPVLFLWKRIINSYNPDVPAYISFPAILLFTVSLAAISFMFFETPAKKLTRSYMLKFT